MHVTCIEYSWNIQQVFLYLILFGNIPQYVLGNVFWIFRQYILLVKCFEISNYLSSYEMQERLWKCINFRSIVLILNPDHVSFFGYFWKLWKKQNSPKYAVFTEDIISTLILHQYQPVSKPYFLDTFLY